MRPRLSHPARSRSRPTSGKRVSATSLKAIEEKFKTAVQLALNEENERWKNKGKIAVDIKLLGYRPAGETPESAPIVKTSAAVSKALGFDSRMGEGSTDSNYPMSL